MTGFLDLPLELRNYVYEILLWEEMEPQFRGVMVVSETYVKNHLPLRCYRGLLAVCHQILCEFKQAIQHMVASKEMQYELTITFSHGRPYFSLTWLRFPGLSATVNHLLINVDLRTREPLQDRAQPVIPHEHELVDLLEDSPESFAGQLFDYIAILLKTLANLLAIGDRNFSTLYTEVMTLNLRTPTKVVPESGPAVHNPIGPCRRIRVDREEARTIHDIMRSTLKATSKGFKAFNASECNKLFPLIQVGTLRFANEGEVWGEGNNLVLAQDDFQWLRY